MSADRTIFPVSWKNPSSPEVVVGTVVVVVSDRTETTTVAVSESGGVPPSVAVTVKVYVVPAGTPDKST